MTAPTDGEAAWRLHDAAAILRHWPGEPVAVVYSAATADSFLVDAGSLDLLRLFMTDPSRALTRAELERRLTHDVERLDERLQSLASSGLIVVAAP